MRENRDNDMKRGKMIEDIRGCVVLYVRGQEESLCRKMMAEGGSCGGMG